MDRVLLMIGSLFALLSVALGALGAHALRKKLSSDQLAVYQTGVQYQMYHALGLLALGIYAAVFGQNGWLTLSAVLMVIGVILFSGSLYMLTLTGKRGFGAITPLGGLSWIISWVLFMIAVIAK